MVVRNRFNSVALSHRLGGLIPWFLKPKQEKEQERNPCSFRAAASIRAKPEKFLSESKIFIHGLERTGTGYCTKLLQENLYNVELIDVTKHHFFNPTSAIGKPPYQKDTNLVKHVICVKHPYSWFLSYKKYNEVNCGGAVPGVNALTHNPPHAVCGTHVETYNRLYNHWIDKCSNSNLIHIVRYEDLLENPEASIALLSSRFNLHTKGSSFTNPAEYLNNFSRHETDEGKFSRRDYYLKKEYMHDLSPENKDTINKVIDKKLMNILGYQLEF
tara:strand:- start:28955 stop:29770 length:816 start_codon:yes stop_codon:yes gene_type:complete